jgi:hypothetical protein
MYIEMASVKMAWNGVLLAAVLLPAVCSGLSLPKIFGDGMVLQSEPFRYHTILLYLKGISICTNFDTFPAVVKHKIDKQSCDQFIVNFMYCGSQCM